MKDETVEAVRLALGTNIAQNIGVGYFYINQSTARAVIEALEATDEYKALVTDANRPDVNVRVIRDAARWNHYLEFYVLSRGEENIPSDDWMYEHTKEAINESWDTERASLCNASRVADKEAGA
jgi:hypothetical protein